MSESIERYPLDGETIQVIVELREQIKAANISLNAILAYFCRIHKLSGKVQLAEDGRQLIISSQEGGIISDGKRVRVPPQESNRNTTDTHARGAEDLPASKNPVPA